MADGKDQKELNHILSTSVSLNVFSFPYVLFLHLLLMIKLTDRRYPYVQVILEMIHIPPQKSLCEQEIHYMIYKRCK